MQKDRIGTWEVSGLAVRCCVSGTVRIGKVSNRADDARTREVGPRRSSCEACEQSVEPLPAEAVAAAPAERRAGAKGNTHQQSTYRTQNQAACHRRWNAYGNLPSHTRGRSRMRESRTYGLGGGRVMKARPYRY